MHIALLIWGGGSRVKSNLCNIFSSIFRKDFAPKSPNTFTFPYKPIDYTLSSCIVFSHSPTPPTEIEYIHFVDSDDMLSLDCIEKCINNIGECDIIWHDTKYIYEDGINPNSQVQSLPELLKLDTTTIQNSLETMQIWHHIKSFSWVCGGIFHISLCEKLRFTPQIQSEDALFGMVLFANAKKVRILPQSLYIYRMRANSISDHTLKQDSPLKAYPPYMVTIAYTFANSYKIKHYHFAYSCTYVCLGLLAYIQMLDDSKTKLKRKLIEFLQVRAIYAFGAMCFEFDPKHIRPLLQPLEPYMNKVPKSTKIAYFVPRLYRFLKWVNKKRKELRKINDL